MFETYYMEIEELLDMLGNETRREILQLLSERPCYVSELSQELKIGQKAVIEHLNLMRQAGMLESRVKKIEKGRPRKYYIISQDVILEVRIGQDAFDMETMHLEIDDKILDTLPKLKRITQKLNAALDLESEEKVEALEDIYEELELERKNVSDAKNAIEALMSRIKNEVRQLEFEPVL